MDGETLCETEKFFQRFIDNENFTEDLAQIKALISNMGRFGNLSQDRFRHEDNVLALPKTPNKLRLYFIYCNSNTVILCGGGQKTSQKVQDSPDAYPHFKLAKKIDDLFRDRVLSGEISYEGKYLGGTLDFDTNIL
ncbi:hypothetical protein VF13_39195 [Nostoc linckia z16]|nr:hypothetical protein VF13_39195 [Nostoc linckia z16]